MAMTGVLLGCGEISKIVQYKNLKRFCTASKQAVVPFVRLLSTHSDNPEKPVRG